MSNYLLLRELRVQNANALASSFSFGFPAVTAFMGFAHALERAIEALQIHGVGIISHRFEMQDYTKGFSRNLKLMANPLNHEGNRSSIIEEGRCHFTVSLLLEIEPLPDGELPRKRIYATIENQIYRMKLAGGDILGLKAVIPLPDESRSLQRLMPGFVLIERRELMQQAMEQGQDALDALHGLMQIYDRSEVLESGEGRSRWRRQQAGWLIPIAVGFQAISSLVVGVEQSRDRLTPHRFAENLVTMGEFMMPHRLESLASLIWRYQVAGDLYTCTQNRT